MMRKTEITRFLVGLFFVLTLAVSGFAQSPASKPSDACESAALKSQASRFANSEIVSRAEERAEKLMAQLSDLQTQEINLQARLDDLDYRLTPDGMQRALAFVGSVRPMDELRDALRTRLEKEKVRLNKQLELLESRRERLEAAISEADAEVELLRQRLELP